MKNCKILVDLTFIHLWSLLLLCLVSCQDEYIEKDTSNPDGQNVNSTLKSVITPALNWENLDWMPTPAGQSSIPSPWNGQGSLSATYGIDVLNDRNSSDGWELLYNTFTTSASGPLQNPYFILYNKYRGTMRVFLYLTTQFVTTSSYLQDGISVVSNSSTSILSFCGQDIIDATKNITKYQQMQPIPADGSLPLASNRWYMMQYELAYDSKLPLIPYNNIQLSWNLNYYNVQKVSLGGSIVGQLNGTIGSASSGTDLFSPLMGIAKTSGTGVLAAIGSQFIEKNTIDNATGTNKLGMSNNNWKSISSGVNAALSSATGNIPGAVTSLLSAIIGGSSGGSTPISLNFNAKITLEGTGTSAGSFPSTPISFWVPGTNISTSAVGYIPAYNKNLGVINFNGKPDVFFDDGEGWAQYSGDPQVSGTYTIFSGSITFPKSINFSNYLQINPEVLKIAKVTIISQDLIMKNPNNESTFINPVGESWYYDDAGHSDYNRWIFGAKFGVRFTVKVEPFNGAPASIIIKTFAINGIISPKNYHDLT
ncbi:MAG: hypothetical protein ACK5M3_06720 [Dysgonomonas sp.]